MKLYELEIKGKTKQTKHLRAKNLNEAQAKAIAKKWEILNIKEIQKASFKRLDDARFILFFQELSLLCEVGISIKDALKELDKIYSHKMIAKLCDNLNLGQNLSLAFENEELFLHKSQTMLINQLLEFPEGKNDDAPDSLAGAFLLARTKSSIKRRKHHFNSVSRIRRF